MDSLFWLWIMIILYIGPDHAACPLLEGQDGKVITLENIQPEDQILVDSPLLQPVLVTALSGPR